MHGETSLEGQAKDDPPITPPPSTVNDVHVTAGWIWDEARGEGITNGTSGDVQEGRGKGGLGLLRKKLRGGKPKGGRGRGGWLEGMTRSSRRRRARGAQEGGARGKGRGARRENSGSGSRDVR